MTNQDPLVKAYQQRKSRIRTPGSSRRLVMDHARHKLGTEAGFNLWNWFAGVSAVAVLAILFHLVNWPSNLVPHEQVVVNMVEYHSL